MAYPKIAQLGVPIELYSGSLPSTAIAMPARRVQLTIQSIPTNGAASALKIQGSDDGTTFHDISGAVMNTATGNIIDVTTSAKMIRLNGSFTADALSVLCVAKA